VCDFSVFVLEDGPRAETSLIASPVTSAASLSLTLSKPLFLYLHKLKVLKPLSLCSPSFTGIAFPHPTEDFPQVIAASLGKDGLCGGSTPELRVDEAQVFVLCCYDFFFSPSDGCFSPTSVLVRSAVPNGCLSLNPQPSASDSVLVVDKAPVSMASTSKIHEATTSSSRTKWNFGFESDEKDEEEGIAWVEEGDDFPWEGDGVFPQDQKARDDAAVAMYLSGAWSITQVLNGLSRVPLLPSKAGSASKPKGQRELNNLKCSINYEGSSRGKGKKK